jgi:hypothetical protein
MSAAAGRDKNIHIPRRRHHDRCSDAWRGRQLHTLPLPTVQELKRTPGPSALRPVAAKGCQGPATASQAQICTIPASYSWRARLQNFDTERDHTHKICDRYEYQFSPGTEPPRRFSSFRAWRCFFPLRRAADWAREILSRPPLKDCVGICWVGWDCWDLS